MTAPPRPRLGTPGAAMLRCPEDVSGYREIRYPKQEQVRDRVEGELGRLAKVADDDEADVRGGFTTPGTPTHA